MWFSNDHPEDLGALHPARGEGGGAFMMDWRRGRVLQSWCSANQACSFSRARDLWEILFFSSLGISAYLYGGERIWVYPWVLVGTTYVRPSYSKQASQPW